jgi:intracellular sulfur oxidation DsrE/DsrF family protein
MKKSLWCILTLTLILLAHETSLGQTVLEKETIADLNKTPNYVFGVSDEDGLKSALSVYDTFLENGVGIENFEIVVKGPVVKTMTKGSELEAYFEKYKGKIRVSICSVAMKRLGVSKEQLFSGLDVVETYTIRILQLQALGYNSLSY